MLLTVLPVAPTLRGDVLITEIHYNPSGSDALEFVELYNAGETPVDLVGWHFSDGIRHVFDRSTPVAPGGFVVVARSAQALQAAYPDLPKETTLVGDFEGALDNGGERLALRDADGADRDVVEYDDVLPWDFLADGLGSSLERICLETATDVAENWRASPLPPDSDEAIGGTPGRVRDGTFAPDRACPPTAVERAPVFLSEILYHAVLEEALEDEYEFVEIHNAGVEALSLAGWRLRAGIAYDFPDTAEIPGGGYLVVAKDPEKLRSVESYRLDPALVLGPYDGTLDNGGEKVALIDANGTGIDLVQYDDGFPWPHAADGLGAGEAWLRPEFLPLEAHRHRGHSLERVSFDVPAAEVANWVASPLDGATPGRPNASARATPLLVVEDIDVESAADGERSIEENDDVVVRVAFSPGAPAAASIEYFVEDIEHDDEPRMRVPLAPVEDRFEARLPRQAVNSIVRYRVRIQRDVDDVVLSPRPDDPYEWHAYFVRPPLETSTATYHLFLSARAWGQLERNLETGRVVGCEMSPTWNNKERGVVVYEGQVFDTRVRFQGSRWNRRTGDNITGWTVPGPDRGAPRVRSWRLSLPRYSRLDGRSVIMLNKLTQACPGQNSGVGYRLFAMADLPSPRTRYARLHINGGYYRYMMEYERPGEELLRRYHREMAEKYPERPREKVGHLFKSVGCTCDEGPFGWGDWRQLEDFCDHSAATRYAHTYGRKTHEWDGPAEIQKLIEDMHVARGSGIDAMRSFVLENFDFELLLNYLVIINWQVPFDDFLQNHFIYQRLSDGRWLLAPWDLDNNFGQWQGATCSIYHGMEGDSCNRSGWWHRLKDTVLRAFDEEYRDHLLMMNNGLLHPDHVGALVDEVTREANQSEADSAAARLSCGPFEARAASFRNFAFARQEFVNREVLGVLVDAGPDVTVFQGRTVRLDARASTPPPSEDVTYRWDNGLEGNHPEFVAGAVGESIVTLTITIDGIEFKDSIIVDVVPVPDEAFAEEGGLVVLEAESHTQNLRRDSESAWWLEKADVEGYSGSGFMHAHQVEFTFFRSDYVKTAPELRYAILFQTPGTYRVWMRGLAETGRSDSVHISLNAEDRGIGKHTRFVRDPERFQWSDRLTGGPQGVVVESANLHFLSVWIRESNFRFDKVVLTTDPDFVPEELGPPESAKQPTDSGGFVRGDANGDERVNLVDALAIVGHLFGRQPLECEDAGDVDDNGRLDVTDAQRLLNFLFARADTPLPPFPGRGSDPTRDAFPCGDGT